MDKQNLIKNLKQINFQPNPAWSKGSLQKLQKISDSSVTLSTDMRKYERHSVTYFLHYLRMNAKLTSVLIASGLLVFGVPVTAFAASNSLPGQPLYHLQHAIEQARVGLTLDAQTKANVQLDLAQKRLDEIETLSANGNATGNSQGIKDAADDYNVQIAGSLSSLQSANLSGNQSADLLNKISESMHKFQSKISDLESTNEDTEVKATLDTSKDKTTEVEDNVSTQLSATQHSATVNTDDSTSSDTGTTDDSAKTDTESHTDVNVGTSSGGVNLNLNLDGESH